MAVIQRLLYLPGDNIRANGISQKWTPLRMLPAPGSIARKLTKQLPSTRLQGGKKRVNLGAAGGRAPEGAGATGASKVQ